jgi:hypothetical protein
MDIVELFVFKGACMEVIDRSAAVVALPTAIALPAPAGGTGAHRGESGS